MDHRWAVTNLRDGKPICPFSGLGRAPDTAAAWIPMKLSSDAMVAFYTEKLLPGYDGLYLDEDNDAFRGTWQTYITAESEGEFSVDGTGAAATVDDLQAQYAAWRTYLTSGLRQALGPDRLFLANVNVPTTADPSLNGITVEFEHCRPAPGQNVSVLSSACREALRGQHEMTNRAGLRPVSAMWLTHSEVVPAAQQCREMADVQRLFPWVGRGDDITDCTREGGPASCVHCS